MDKACSMCPLIARAFGICHSLPYINKLLEYEGTSPSMWDMSKLTTREACHTILSICFSCVQHPHSGSRSSYLANSLLFHFLHSATNSTSSIKLSFATTKTISSIIINIPPIHWPWPKILSNTAKTIFSTSIENYKLPLLNA